MLTKNSNENNSKIIAETLNKVLAKCYHCSDNKMSSNYVEVYCYKCETICCKKCLNIHHNTHATLALGKIK